MKLIYFFIVGALFTSCNNGGSSSGSVSTENYEQSKMSLEDQEKSDPLKFLSVEGGTYRKTIFGNKMELEGKIFNSATIATFKDVVLHIRFNSETETEVGTADHTIYEFFAPNTSKPFKFKIEIPDGANSAGFEVISATAN
jgi:hypothetical protein